MTRNILLAALLVSISTTPTLVAAAADTDVSEQGIALVASLVATMERCKPAPPELQDFVAQNLAKFSDELASDEREWRLVLRTLHSPRFQEALKTWRESVRQHPEQTASECRSLAKRRSSMPRAHSIGMTVAFLEACAPRFPELKEAAHGPSILVDTNDEERRYTEEVMGGPQFLRILDESRAMVKQGGNLEVRCPALSKRLAIRQHKTDTGQQRDVDAAPSR